MNKRLVGYLQDNRDHIIEDWLTESELPAPVGAQAANGSVPVAFLESVFDRVLNRIKGKTCKCGGTGECAKLKLGDILGVTCACQTYRLRGHVCLELHEAGARAFMGIFSDTWDIQGEFNELDREASMKLIGEALDWIFSQEIFRCPQRTENEDCPFILN
ncbi:hypothetical protein [Cerasicoccus arenae]|uniref:Uncharacterized protein n=1 Tax=Cerasicoccus arenae TaxID=424488 RepID=A0A8J3DCG4_9BACT|nr:hypothetical protein [Cerasicoccus arenae]MBK1857647.1 hypothetical protein [Cerasicoccus arenae]GHC05351.1 hypothetical protein GCM10007047_22800 [Cerasicoccus arenae]